MEGLGMDEGGGMMDRDELEELLGLRVQFGDAAPSMPLVPCKEPAINERTESDHWPGLTGRKPDSPGQHVQVDICREAFKMWTDVGATQGLHTDPEIATFLLQHYENTKQISIPSGNCTVCSQPLSLFCSHCQRPVQHLPSSAALPTTQKPKKEKTILEQPSELTHEQPSEISKETPPKIFTFSTLEQLSEISQMTPPKFFTFSDIQENCIKREDKVVDSTIFQVKPKCESHVNIEDVNDGSCDDEYDDGGVNAQHLGENQESGPNPGTKGDIKEKCGEDLTSDNQVAELPRQHGKQHGREHKGKQHGRKCNSKHLRADSAGKEGKVFRCVVCGRTYTRACSLKVHMRKHTGEKPFKCKRCDATFSLSGSLVVHQRTHTGDKPFVCEECDQRFSIANALKQHRRQHTGEKPYHCKICFSRYSRSDSLKVHMRTHSGDRPFICEMCGANFSRLYCLIAHKKKHSGERPFKCSECPASFVQSGKLTIHMRKHTGDRPFQCEQCGASFTQSERLKTHLRIHSGEKPYKCVECGKGFSHPHSLKVHGRVHSGDRPYKCDFCSLTFADPSYFRRHKAKHANTSDLETGTVAGNSDPNSVADYLDTAAVDDFAVSLSEAETMNTFQAAGMTLSSNVSTMVANAFHDVSTSPETMDSADCFTEATSDFAMPLSSTVPSLGFSGPTSAGLGFSVPSTMNIMTDGADSMSSASASDPFAFLRTALHCPGSFPN